MKTIHELHMEEQAEAQMKSAHKRFLASIDEIEERHEQRLREIDTDETMFSLILLAAIVVTIVLVAIEFLK